jgi:hypothetical protein
MKSQQKVLAFSALMCLVCFATRDGLTQTPIPRKFEAINVRYELALSKCRNGACHVEPAGKGEISISLDPEDRSFSWGCDTVTDKIGAITYYFYFLASHNSRKGSRVFAVTLAGRLYDSKQVTWAQKYLSKSTWRTFPILSVSGNEYSDNGDTVTPKLDVQVLPYQPGYKLD